MKQIIQYLGNGETLLAEVPCPAIRSGSYLIESRKSLVSIGTEKMLVDFGKAGWLSKARQQPEKVQQVISKIQSDGLFATLESVKSKLDQPVSLGYSNVGTVAAGEFQGRRIASNGPHAEVVSVPHRLCAFVPDAVSDESAAYTVVGSIGLQGIRLIQPTLGETIVVMGLGLIGLLTVQMLVAQGCRVLGVDLDSSKCELARSYGADTCDLSQGQDLISLADDFTQGQGVDGVIITASAKSDQIVSDAAKISRKRGRIVLVGVVGLKLNRADFYEKELSFQVSCSYGPGRYDPAYEEQGHDYPLGFVRWTEQRNMEAVLDLMARGKIQTDRLTTHEFDFSEALKAYEVVTSGEAMGILLNYPSEAAQTDKLSQTIIVNPRKLPSQGEDTLGVSFIGCGNFTTRLLLPEITKISEVRLSHIVSSGGTSSGNAAAKFGFSHASSESQSVFRDHSTDAVFVTTRHDSHARYVTEALRSGKDVFVEKPLALTLDELTEIQSVVEENEMKNLLMVGFNRRFSPHTLQLKNWLKSSSSPISIMMTVNAGAIPEDHWTQDPEIGGGRVIGEACHFIDLARCLAESGIKNSSSVFLGGHAGRLGDCATLNLEFENGSVATIHYLANGHSSYPKEKVEVFADGKVYTIDNFRKNAGLWS